MRKYAKLIAQQIDKGDTEAKTSGIMAGNATSPSLSEPTTTSNCSTVIVNSLPFELVEATGGYIIIVYVYAVLVVVATLALYVKWVVVEEC